MIEATLRVTRLYHDATILVPRTGNPSINVCAYLKSERGHPIKMAVPPGMTRVVPTGLRITAEAPYTAMLYSTHRNLVIVNPICTDTDDGAVVAMHNASPEPMWLSHEDIVAQLVLVQLPTPIVIEVLNVENDGHAQRPKDVRPGFWNDHLRR